MANTLYNNPSIDPADNNSLAGSIRFAFSKLIQKIQGMLPAQVIAYDRDTNRVQVQLMISLITTSGATVPRPQIASIPVFEFGGGGFFMNFPLNEGDPGWVLANDRDISNFLQSYSMAPPNTNRICQFSDGVFFPDFMRGTNGIRPPNSDGALTIQNSTGTVSIVISDDTITLNAAHNVNIKVGDNAVFTMGETGTGTLGVVGNIKATGTIAQGQTIPPPLP